MIDSTKEQGIDSLDLMINMGPQHPSTHGVFRLVIGVDGERIVRAEPHIGYLHRGSEKLCEAEDYAQIVTLFDRMDYIANLNSELGYALAVEKLMALEIPERAEYIRVILCELNRIASHMLFYGVYGLDVGAMTPVLYGFRERERIQALFEAVTGAHDAFDAHDARFDASTLSLLPQLVDQGRSSPGAQLSSSIVMSFILSLALLEAQAYNMW